MLSPHSPHNGRPLHRCGDDAHGGQPGNSKGPRVQIPSQPVTLDSYTPQGSWTLEDWHCQWVGRDDQIRVTQRTGERREERGEERQREGRQVVLKWETEQMFLAAVNSHDRQQTLRTSLWGGSPLRPVPCIPVVPPGSARSGRPGQTLPERLPLKLCDLGPLLSPGRWASRTPAALSHQGMSLAPCYSAVPRHPSPNLLAPCGEYGQLQVGTSTLETLISSPRLPVTSLSSGHTP